MGIPSNSILLLFFFTSCTLISLAIVTHAHSCTDPDNCSLALSPINSHHVSKFSNRHVLKEDQGKRSTSKHKVGKWILWFFIGGFAGIISGLVFSIVFKTVKGVINLGRVKIGPVLYSPLIKKPEYLSFLENDEEVEKLQVIGEGGCGVVYKAPLQGVEGKYLAIKKITQPKDADVGKKMRQLRSEINTVGHIRHKNLLPLLAHVARSNCHYLVYEYMKNGSLQDVFRGVKEGKRELTWPARHRIALGISSGLEYLHSHNNPRIIHRDLKPANVLLDDDMDAKIADFGMAKAMPHAHTHVTTSNVAGTIGYIAPEYHQTLKFTEKCDVYGFGMVLGVLVAGREPSDEFFQETSEMSMVKWMRNTLGGEDPTAVIDGSLRGSGLEKQMLMMMKVACFCTLDDPRERPNSKQVKHMLSQICN